MSPDILRGGLILGLEASRACCESSGAATFMRQRVVIRSLDLDEYANRVDEWAGRLFKTRLTWR